ncbi:hypothetical protein LIA77_04956 [Sarocladium implicatum]|nr:hypothetical protein LIA77_04956 [Sarocladium implicatum]
MGILRREEKKPYRESRLEAERFLAMNVFSTTITAVVHRARRSEVHPTWFSLPVRCLAMSYVTCTSSSVRDQDTGHRTHPGLGDTCRPWQMVKAKPGWQDCVCKSRPHGRIPLRNPKFCCARPLTLALLRTRRRSRSTAWFATVCPILHADPDSTGFDTTRRNRKRLDARGGSSSTGIVWQCHSHSCLGKMVMMSLL